MRLNNRGFTLLEVLIAVTVLGMLIGLLDQGMAFTLRVTAMQRRLSDGAADLPVVDAALRRLIAQASPGIYPEPASLKGTNNSVAMVTQAPGVDGVLRPVDATLLAAGGALRVRLDAHRHLEQFGAPAQASARNLVLLGGVERLVIDYADGRTGEWRPNWGADTLPALVRMRLVFVDGVQRWPPIIVAPRLEAPGQ